MDLVFIMNTNETLIKAKEGRKMLDKIKQDDYVILLDV